MSAEGNILLEALLDRLGKTQAQALLVRLDQWLSRDARAASPQDNNCLTEINSAPPTSPTIGESTNATEFPK